MEETYGKMPGSTNSDQIIMELKYHYELLSDDLPDFMLNLFPDRTPPQEFLDWMRVDHRSFDYANQFYYTLPEPRYEVYETSSYNEMQDRVLG